MSKYANMSLAELEKMNVDLNNSQDALKAQHREVARALDAARTKQAVADKVAAMSEAEREALKAVLAK